MFNSSPSSFHSPPTNAKRGSFSVQYCRRDSDSRREANVRRAIVIGALVISSSAATSCPPEEQCVCTRYANVITGRSSRSVYPDADAEKCAWYMEDTLLTECKMEAVDSVRYPFSPAEPVEPKPQPAPESD
jgi:hypothetical protein